MSGPSAQPQNSGQVICADSDESSQEISTDFTGEGQQKEIIKRKLSGDTSDDKSEPTSKLKKYGPEDIEQLPINPILLNLVHCSRCEYSTRVHAYMVRHLQKHVEQQPRSKQSLNKLETDIPPPTPIVQVTQAESHDGTNISTDMDVSTEDNIENFCEIFGEFCGPFGLKYLCSLCHVTIEGTKEAMERHLYEELQYRKWGCGFCDYKAFRKSVVQQHLRTKHIGLSRRLLEGCWVELPMNFMIETWVEKLLEYQTAIIEKKKAVLEKQKAITSIPDTSDEDDENSVELPISAMKTTNMVELTNLFGSFGYPKNKDYTCPKCNLSSRKKAVMREHLKFEVKQIKWRCGICNSIPTNMNTLEAAEHYQRKHPDQETSPVENTMDDDMQEAWVLTVLRVQDLRMNL